MNIFGLSITLILFFIFSRLKLKTPIIISVGLCVIFILKFFKIDYKIYYESASMLSFLIAPATIALAYPLYKNSYVLVKNKRIIYFTFLMATLIAIFLTYFSSKALNADYEVIMSLLPKSTTMPIALEISKAMKGYEELTACTVALTGVFGGVFGHRILKFFKVKSDIAIGLALGSASHVIGTAACAQRKNAKQTASATAALVIVGLLSVFIIPLFKKYY